MGQITNIKELEEWLKGQPPEVAAVVALRAALRVLPAVVDEFRIGKNLPIPHFDRLYLSIFRADAAARFAHYAFYGNRAAAAYATARATTPIVVRGEIDASTGVANIAASVYVLKASVSAAAAATAHLAGDTATASYASDAAASATSAPAAFPGGRREVWQAVSADSKPLFKGEISATLLEGPLWPAGLPNWAGKAWTELTLHLISLYPHWQVWIDWYDAILEGKPAWGLPRERAEAIMGEAVLWPNEDWEKGPDHINPRLQALIDAAKAELVQVPDVLPPVQEPAKEEQQSTATFVPNWDFFVSYAHQDEADARQIVTILEDAGLSIFVQFNDFTPGANFVTEMQRGLAGGGQVIALYSPAYVASAHCQAEWNAAYNSDPDGSKRKLVPFLIVPTDLPPLARQIVFKSLVGLSNTDRQKAVLEAIAPPKVRSIAQIKKAAASLASPQPKLNADGSIGLKPNEATDTPRTTRDLAHLPVYMRDMIRNILNALPKNTPLVVRHGLDAYRAHLKERGTKLEPQYLNRVFAGIEGEYYSTGVELWGKGLEIWIAQFFNDHNTVKTHFPLRDEEVFAEAPINEAEAMGDAIIRPAQIVDVAAQEMVEDKLADESFGKLFRSVAEQGRDYAHFPPDQNAGQPGSTRVSVKRRYVVGALGLFVAFYNFVGSTASIMATETGARFFKALGEAIEMLSKLLLR